MAQTVQRSTWRHRACATRHVAARVRACAKPPPPQPKHQRCRAVAQCPTTPPKCSPRQPPPSPALLSVTEVLVPRGRRRRRHRATRGTAHEGPNRGPVLVLTRSSRRLDPRALVAVCLATRADPLHPLPPFPPLVRPQSRCCCSRSSRRLNRTKRHSFRT